MNQIHLEWLHWLLYSTLHLVHYCDELEKFRQKNARLADVNAKLTEKTTRQSDQICQIKLENSLLQLERTELYLDANTKQ